MKVKDEHRDAIGIMEKPLSPSRPHFPIFTRPKSRGLFFHIFLWFWLAMTLAGIVLLVLEADRMEKMATRWRSVTRDAFDFYATSAVKDHEDTESWQSREFLTDLEQRTGIRAWLFDERGREVSGYARAAYRAQFYWLEPRLRDLRQRAIESNGAAYKTLSGITLAADVARAPSGRLYVLAGMLPAARFRPFQATPAQQVLRLLAIQVIAGLVSWLLARYLTLPIETLRLATRNLAGGDVSARAGMHLQRRDELGELARDFNHMAERIETLLHDRERLVIAQRRLMADVAHELRSPLARMNVTLELARDALQNDGIKRRDAKERDENGVPASNPSQVSLDRIDLEVTRLSEMIDRLLMLSRLESGEIQSESTPVDLAALVRSVAADADFEAHPQQRAVSVTKCDAAVVYGTPNLLHSAVENIVRNAVRHTPADSTVEITLVCESGDEEAARRWLDIGTLNHCYVSPLPQDQVEMVTEEKGGASSISLTPDSSSFAIVTVRDWGPGVSEVELSEVFRPFYRAGGGRDSSSGGVGLGLAITARVIEVHRSQLRVCNASDGGLIIELRVPLCHNWVRGQRAAMGSIVESNTPAEAVEESLNENRFPVR